MSPLGALRRLWRGLIPERMRLKAQPVLSRALEDYVRTLARQPHGAENTEGPIRIVGYMSASHGIGASARLAAQTLEALGAWVETVDIADAVLDWTGRYSEPQKAAAWIFYLNPPEMLAALAGLGPNQLIGPRYGLWAWELPRAPRQWLRDGALVDEIWAPSCYTAEALTGARAPVRVAPHPLRIDAYANVVPAPRRAQFQAVTLFDFNSSMARKNPQGAVAAFAQAFGTDSDARLVIKTQNGDLYPDLLADLRAGAPSNVEIIDAVWPYAEVKRLIAGADVLISLHRAEGFGLTPAEAMAMGTAVLATAFSGNLDFMDETCAELVPAGRVPVEDPQGIYGGQTWAEPDLEAAARALVRLRDDPVRRQALAKAGRAMVEARLSPQAWLAALPPAVQAAVARGRAL